MSILASANWSAPIRSAGSAKNSNGACLAVRQQVSASTQNQALCALLFLCREVLGLDVDDLSATARAKRGPRLPTVLSVPETGALLGAMRGTPWLMAALIHGGDLYLGHTNVETTMVYTHVVKELRTPPRSPLNVLKSVGHQPGVDR